MALVNNQAENESLYRPISHTRRDTGLSLLHLHLKKRKKTITAMKRKGCARLKRSCAVSSSDRPKSRANLKNLNNLRHSVQWNGKRNRYRSCMYTHPSSPT